MPPLSSDIEYAESGSGPALLFMPGAFSTGAASRGVIEHLGEGYRVITTSLLGYGATAERRPAGNRTMAQQVEVLEATIAHIGAPVHVIGHSYGGASVITHAISGALKPASLVLVEAPLADILRATGDQEHHEMFGAVANAYFAAFEDGQPEAARHVIDFPLLLALEVAPALIQAMVSVPSVRIPLSPPER